MKTSQGNLNVYKYAPTKTIHANDVTFAYRDLGPQGGVPVVLLNHWGASAAGRPQDHRQGWTAALGRCLSHRDA